MWGRGELGYEIAVEGSMFREVAGDDGMLVGIFTGTNHEGAAGTLERDDLTSASEGRSGGSAISSRMLKTG